LQELKNDPDLKDIPVIVLTTSDDGGDILRSYQLHANAYLTKPMDFNAFAETIRQIDNFFLSLVKLPRTKNSAGRRGAGRAAVRTVCRSGRARVVPGRDDRVYTLSRVPSAVGQAGAGR
jgi:response regulator RpfG family c-di-GMP phosphodiesterase